MDILNKRQVTIYKGWAVYFADLRTRGQYHKKDTESFIAEAKAIHDDFYGYSLTQYKGAREKLTIVCPKHGPFEQVAHVHLRGEIGAGCERCSYEERGERARMSFDEFLRRANEVHQGYWGSGG